MKFVSLCVLAYKRPDRLRECLNSIYETADYPYQLLVNLDGGDQENLEYLFNTLQDFKISSLVLNGSKNRGVGRSFNNLLGLCEGDYIIKIDTDLTFKDKWLSETVRLLDKYPNIGAISLFNYNNYDPLDTRFKITSEYDDLYQVNDFVSSIYAFRASDLSKIYPVSDDGNHTKLGNLGITKRDLCDNSGFGVGKSVYVSGTMEHPYKTPTFDTPLILNTPLNKNTGNPYSQ